MPGDMRAALRSTSHCGRLRTTSCVRAYCRLLDKLGVWLPNNTDSDIMLQLASIFMTTLLKNMDDYGSNNMSDVVSSIFTQFDRQSLTWPETVRSHDRTWLRFYLDFCWKHQFPSTLSSHLLFC